MLFVKAPRKEERKDGREARKEQAPYNSSFAIFALPLWGLGVKHFVCKVLKKFRFQAFSFSFMDLIALHLDYLNPLASCPRSGTNSDSKSVMITGFS